VNLAEKIEELSGTQRANFDHLMHPLGTYATRLVTAKMPRLVVIMSVPREDHVVEYAAVSITTD